MLRSPPLAHESHDHTLAADRTWATAIMRSAIPIFDPHYCPHAAPQPVCHLDASIAGVAHLGALDAADGGFTGPTQGARLTHPTRTALCAAGRPYRRNVMVPAGRRQRCSGQNPAIASRLARPSAQPWMGCHSHPPESPSGTQRLTILLATASSLTHACNTFRA